MTPEQQLARLRDPDRWERTEPGFLPASRSAPAPEEPGRPGAIRAALITAVVLVLLIGGTISVLRATGGAAPAGPPPSTPHVVPSATPSAGTVGALPAVGGRVLATWTSAERRFPSGPFDPDGHAIAVTLSCTGGGEVGWSIPGHGSESHGCEGVTTAGPTLTAKNGRLIAEPRPVRLTVHVTGHPTFAIRLTAVPVVAVPDDSTAPSVAPTGPDVPSSLRSCVAADFEDTGTFERYPHFQGGLLTVRSAGRGDCAIRSLPELRYLDAEGDPIGRPAALTGGDDSGTVPPALLRSGGVAYAEIELFTRAVLTDCGAIDVRALRLQLSGASIRIPIPAEPAVAHCTDDHTEADGVSGLVAVRPAVEGG